jgi:hypothetical protein
LGSGTVSFWEDLTGSTTTCGAGLVGVCSTTGLIGVCFCSTFCYYFGWEWV